MTDCPDCLAASTSHTWGGYTSGCKGCEIRAIAQSPLRIRQQAYADYARRHGDEAMRGYMDTVKAEYRRIDELRGKDHG